MQDKDKGREVRWKERGEGKGERGEGKGDRGEEIGERREESESDLRTRLEIARTHQLLNILRHVLPQRHSRYEEVDAHPGGPVLLGHGDVLYGGDVERHRPAVDGQEDGFFLHVYFQLGEIGIGIRFAVVMELKVEVKKGKGKIVVKRRRRGGGKRRRVLWHGIMIERSRECPCIVL